MDTVRVVEPRRFRIVDKGYGIRTLQSYHHPNYWVDLERSNFSSDSQYIDKLEQAVLDLANEHIYA